MADDTMKLVIDADAEKAIREMQRLSVAATRTADQLHKIEQAAEKTTKKTRSLSDGLGDLHKANNVVGGSFGAITGPLDDFGDLIERVGIKNAAMMAGVGAAAAAIVALGANVVDVAANWSDYETQLGKTNDTINRNRDAIMDAADAMDGAWRSITEFRVELAGDTAGALQNGATLVGALAHSFTYMLEQATPLPETLGTVSKAIDAMGKSSIVSVSALGALLGRLRNVLVGEQDTAQFEAQAARDQAAAAKLAETMIKRGEEAEKAKKDAASKAAAAAREAAAAERERAAALERETKALEDAITADVKRSAQTSSNARGIAAFHAMPQAEQDAARGVQTSQPASPFALGAETFGDSGKQIVDSAKKNSQEWAQHWQNGIGAAASAFEQFAQIAVQVGSAIIAGTEKDTKKAKKKQFALEKAAALSIATIQTFQAVVQALGSTAPPASFVLAALAGAAGAVQIGMIAAQQPKFHRGGILPDEVDRQGYRARQNESTAVLTAQALRAMGGQEGINRANAGQPVATGDTYLVVDGVPRKARQFAGPDPSFGIARRGMGAYA